MNARRLCLLLGVVLALSLTGVLATEATIDEVLRGRAPSSVDECPAVAAPVLRGHLRPQHETGIPYIPGDDLLYEFASDESITVTLPAFRTGSEVREVPPMEVHLRVDGRLGLKVHAPTEHGYVVGVRIEDLRIENVTEGRGPIPQPKLGDRELSALAAISATGEFGKLALPDDLPAGHRRILRGILARFQTILPDCAPEGSCERRERDARGAFLARYERLSPEGSLPLVMVKRKVRYEEIHDAALIERDGRVEVAGEIRYELDPLPLLIEGYERGSVQLGEGGLTQAHETRFHFRRIAHERTRSDAHQGHRLEQGEASDLMAEDEGIADLDPEKGRQRMDDLFAELRAAAGQGASGRTTAHRLAFQIANLLQEHAGLAEAVLTRLMEAPVSSLEAAHLVASLAAAGTRPSQEVLLELVGAGSGRDRYRNLALASLLQVEAPIPELDAVLLRLHEEGRTEAGLMVLATLGDRVRTTDPERYDAIRTRVLEEAGAARSPSELAGALRALSNIRLADVPKVTTSSLASADLRVRVAAIESLVRIETAEADDLLLDVLRNGRDGVERLMALRTLVRRNQESHAPPGAFGQALVAVLEEVGSNDEDEDVRKAAASLAEKLRQAG